MKSYSSREILQILIEEGWYIASTRGDHYQRKPPDKERTGNSHTPS